MDIKPLLPVVGSRQPQQFGLKYWGRGLTFTIPRGRRSLQAFLYYFLLQISTGCCPVIANFLMQLLITRNSSSSTIPLAVLAFDVIPCPIANLNEGIRTIIGEETCKRIMNQIHGRQRAHTNISSSAKSNGSESSINKAMSFEIVQKEVLSLLISVVTLCLQIITFEIQQQKIRDVAALLLPLYAIFDISYTAIDVLRTQALAQHTATAKNILSRKLKQ